MALTELCYILGCLRDGSLPICGLKKEVSLASDTNIGWLKIIAQKASNEFSIPIQRFKFYEVWDVKSKVACYRLKVYSKELYEELAKHYKPGDQVFWKTPEIVKFADFEAQKNYVAGFYDAEGGCRNVARFRSGLTRTLHCWSSIACKHSGTNEPLSFIRNILDKVGVCSHIYDSDELVITGKSNLGKFANEFNLLHPKKKEQLEELLSFFGAQPANA